MLVLALLPACSAIKIAYNQAPDLSFWWIDSYIDFNSQQSPKARDEIARLFAWHRSSELPKVAALLQKTQALLPGPITAAQACGLYGQARSLLETLADKTVQGVAELAPTLGPEQLRHLEHQYEKKNDESLRESQKGSPAERAAKRLKQAVERSEMLYGRLEEAQITLIQRLMEKSTFDPEKNRKERLRRQQDALALLGKLSAGNGRAPDAMGLLRGYVARSFKSPDPAYRAYADKLTRDGCESFAVVHNSTSAEQRAKAAATLASYELDLRALAAQK